MIKAVLFDFDGTLVDSDRITFDEIVSIAKNFHLSVPTYTQILTFRGVPVINILKELYPHLSEDKINELIDFKRRNMETFLPQIQLKPFVNEALHDLKQRYLLGLVTSRAKYGLQFLLNAHNLKELFEVIICHDDSAQHKPHPEGILKAMEFLHVTSQETVYVGDTEIDVLTAHNAKIPCILISDSEETRADYHLKSLEDLTSVIMHIDEK